MTKTRPDPDTEYVSKYLLDFNKRELDKFFHPEKYPKAVLSVAVLSVVVFFFIAWMFPLKDQLLNSAFQKNPASASNDRESENISISGPLAVKKGDQFTLLVTVRSDSKQIRQLMLDLNYPTEMLTLLAAKPLGVHQGEASLKKTDRTMIGIDFTFSPVLQSAGTQQELLALTFQSEKTGRAYVTFSDSTKIIDLAGQDIGLWQNNYSVIISE
jgi:hypothetical protein